MHAPPSDRGDEYRAHNRAARGHSARAASMQNHTRQGQPFAGEWNTSATPAADRTHIPNRNDAAYLRWWRMRLRIFLYLCFRIFFRRFLTTLPIWFPALVAAAHFGSKKPPYNRFYPQRSPIDHTVERLRNGKMARSSTYRDGNLPGAEPTAGRGSVGRAIRGGAPATMVAGRQVLPAVDRFTYRRVASACVRSVSLKGETR